ncbi:MAG TPA: hypothetical protein VFL96_02440, partial [Acidobacteriaceae bacterium]|nr:hypothetical protein [Acidobacteriaceae bacterium]
RVENGVIQPMFAVPTLSGRLPEPLQQFANSRAAGHFAGRESAHPVANNKYPGLKIVSEEIFIVGTFATYVGQGRDFNC